MGFGFEYAASAAASAAATAAAPIEAPTARLCVSVLAAVAACGSGVIVALV